MSGSSSPNVAAHFRKPEEAHRGIDAMFPDLPKVELFARPEADRFGDGTQNGWDTWGLEARLRAQPPAHASASQPTLAEDLGEVDGTSRPVAVPGTTFGRSGRIPEA